MRANPEEKIAPQAASRSWDIESGVETAWPHYSPKLGMI